MSRKDVGRISATHDLSRREFLALSGKGSAAAAVTAAAATLLPASAAHAESEPIPPPDKPDELTSLSTVALVKAIREKQVSSEEVVNAYLDRIAAVNPKLNAVVQLTAETARAQAKEADAALARGENKGPLHGVPFTVKDNIETAGVICTAGTQGRANFVPEQDATVVARIRAAGAIMLGKTNLPEIGLAVESDNLVYGRTNNPYDLSRTPGGSSGGEGAIIAAGGSPFGLGNDAGGSIRLPAHYCGIAGIKPNSGRVSRTGTFPGPGGIIDNVWQNGPMARYVEDLALILPLIAGVDGRDAGLIPMPLGDPTAVELKSLRVAVHTDNGIVPPSTETVDTVQRAAKNLSEVGLAVEEKRPPGIEQTMDLLGHLMFPDGSKGLQQFLTMIGSTEIHPMLQHMLKIVRAYESSTTSEFAMWVYKADMFRSAMLAFMDQYDVILCPVNAYPAVLHGTSHIGAKAFAASYTMTYNLTGWPGAVVRCGTSPEGLPINVQVVSKPWREDVALAVAQHLETAFGGWQPPSLASLIEIPSEAEKSEAS